MDLEKVQELARRGTEVQARAAAARRRGDDDVAAAAEAELSRITAEMQQAKDG